MIRTYVYYKYLYEVIDVALFPLYIIHDIIQGLSFFGYVIHNDSIHCAGKKGDIHYKIKQSSFVFSWRENAAITSP